MIMKYVLSQYMAVGKYSTMKLCLDAASKNRHKRLRSAEGCGQY